MPSVLEGPQSEEAFLAGQANEAVAAMQQTVQAMQASARAVLDIHWWVEYRPWLTVGGAALGGLAAASLLPRGKTTEEQQVKQTRHSSFLSSLAVFALGTVRGAAVSALTSALTSTLLVDQKVEEVKEETLRQAEVMR